VRVKIEETCGWGTSAKHRLSKKERGDVPPIFRKSFFSWEIKTKGELSTQSVRENGFFGEERMRTLKLFIPEKERERVERLLCEEKEGPDHGPSPVERI